MADRPTVYYDGGCPVCSREVRFYQGRDGSDSFAWVDVARANEEALGLGLSREAEEGNNGEVAVAESCAGSIRIAGESPPACA